MSKKKSIEETQAEQFLSELFQDGVSKEAQIVIWAKGHGSTWCSSVCDAASTSVRAGAHRDVYFGCTLQNPERALSIVRDRSISRGETPPDKIEAVRGVADSAVSMGGVWVDVDVGQDGHKKKNYPPTVEAALDVLNTAVPMRPTIVVSSGGGLHVWWLLKELLLFTNDEERARSARLVRGVQETVRLAMQARGWHLDSTHDLARVLRVPGTTNRKIPDAPRPCRLLSWSPERRYNPDSIGEWCSDVPEETPKAKEFSTLASEIAVDPRASPPAEVLTLCLEDPKFKATWEHRRPDLKDQSPSGYDFALMMMLKHRGASDQIVVDFCVAHRRMHKQEVKDARYFALSLANAKRAIGMDGAEGRLIEHAGTLEAEGGSPSSLPRSKKEQILKDLSERFGVTIERVEKFLVDDPTWHLVVEGGRRIEIGTIQSVRSPRNFTDALAKNLDREFPDVSRERWKAISRLVLAVADPVEFGAESTHGGEAPQQWIWAYVSANPPQEDQQRALAEGRPFHDAGGKLCVALGHFRRWLYILEREDMSRPRLAALLRTCGWTRRTVAVATGATRSTRSVWSPPDAVAGRLAQHAGSGEGSAA